MTDREQFEAWFDSLPIESKLLPAHPISAAERFAYLGWQAAIASERAKPNEWQKVVLEKLVVSCIYQNKHDDDPEGAINALLAWETEIALDPQVSCQAQALIDRGAASERAKQAEPADEMIAEAWREAQGKCDHATLRRIYRVFAAPPAVQQPARHEHERGAPLMADCEQSNEVRAAEAESTRLNADTMYAFTADDEAVRLLREARDALPTTSLYEERVEYLRVLRERIDAYLAKHA